jgi:hypothetical protein
MAPRERDGFPQMTAVRRLPSQSRESGHPWFRDRSFVSFIRSYAADTLATDGEKNCAMRSRSMRTSRSPRSARRPQNSESNRR